MKTTEVSQARLGKLLSAIDKLTLECGTTFCSHYCPAGKTININKPDPCTDGPGCRKFMLSWLKGE